MDGYSCRIYSGNTCLGTLCGLGFYGDLGNSWIGLGLRFDLKISIGVVTSEMLFVIGSVSTCASLVCTFSFSLVVDFDIVDDECAAV
jgi:hypothetical protein